MYKSKLFAASAILLVISVGCSKPQLVNAKQHQRLLAAKTQQFIEKEGFERKEKDVINTLKDNDVAKFSTLLDGFIQAYSLDSTLKGNGPFTIFAPTDKAFRKMPDDDRMSLWANKDKLKQVLQYMVVDGKIKTIDLKKEPKLSTKEGHSISITTKGNDIYADKSLILTTDIPCSNGVIHVLDEVIMPPLSK
ncbi:MAG: fasciclin domain-containing protein [Candidatus Melainabacteria bacterium]|nr:fasciclin domain-containing protein [Candidatus Melainabacteria bacterium]